LAGFVPAEIIVMPALVAGIYDLQLLALIKDVDGRNKSGHDGLRTLR
jgi:hypothetical protein